MALSSVVAAVFLTVLKSLVGISTGSLGILSEALHSALDLVAAGITLFAVRASARPADREHHYGHAKVENLSALIETLLLLVTAVWIVVEAGRRLFLVEVEIEPSMWAFAVMGISIVIDLSRSRALAKVARTTGSQALEADALHFSTDVWSSSVVIVGLGLVWLAREINQPWLVKADALAALAVAGIVVHVSLQLGRRTVADLLDEAPAGLRDRIATAARVDGVHDVNRTRVRRSGAETFVDFTLQIAPDVTLEQGHAIATSAERAVRDLLPGADVVVHIEPDLDAEADRATVDRVADARKLAAKTPRP